MKMYPGFDLYKKYKEVLIDNDFSTLLPDVTKKNTLQNINYAINVADKWDTCMDIGGGNGYYLAALATKFKKAILVEAQVLPAQKAYAEKLSNFEVVNSYIEKYNTPTKVDFILLADLYEHIPNIENFVTQISKLQEVGGVTYIMTPNPIYCGPAPESGIYHTRHKDGHIKQYTSEEIINTMRKNGYTLILKFYEEAPFRQKAKRLIFALSRRDKKWQKKFIYVIFRPIYLILALIISKILETITFTSEVRNRHNETNTMTQNLVFKKINES